VIFYYWLNCIKIGRDSPRLQILSTKMLRGSWHCFSFWLVTWDLASFPGLLTPAFVTCSLVKLSHIQWHTWTCGEVAHSGKKKQQKTCKWVCYRMQTQTVERLSGHQTVLVTFLGFRKPLYSCTEGMGHSSTHPSMSLHVTQFYQVTSAGMRRPAYEANRELCKAT